MKPTQPKRKQPLFGVAEWITLICCIVLCWQTWQLIYKDNYVSGSLVSNRSFAPPAFLFSFILSSYAAWKIERFDLPLRIGAWLVSIVVGYLSIGLLLIMINGFVCQLARH